MESIPGTFPCQWFNSSSYILVWVICHMCLIIKPWLFWDGNASQTYKNLRLRSFIHPNLLYTQKRVCWDISKWARMVHGCLGLISPPQPQIIVHMPKPQFPCMQRAMKAQPAPEICEDAVTESVLWCTCSLGTRDHRTALVSLRPVHRIASELSRPCILGLWLLSRPKEMEQSIQTSLDFVSTTRNNSLLPVLCALSPSLLLPCWIFLQSFCH